MSRRILKEEYINKFKKLSLVNEAKYRPITNEDFANDDNIPTLQSEADEVNNQPVQPAPELNVAPPNAPQPGNVEQTAQPNPSAQFPADEPAPEVAKTPTSIDSQVNPQIEIDVMQNDIIKKNISALKEIDQNVKKLNNVIDDLNYRYSLLKKDVDEVKEPTPDEKLMKMKDVSYPFTYNINDAWKGAWFDVKEKETWVNQNMNDNSVNNVIKKMPDGTYAADFDELQKFSQQEIDKSFD